MYFWEGKLGFFAFPVFALLVVIYLTLIIALIRQIYFWIKGKFIEKQRLFKIGLLAIVLASVLYKPFGFIDFEKFEGNDLLIAEREGSANCTTTLKLKDDFTFKERSVCFGVTETKGVYHIQNDTIYFDNARGDEHYAFAVIRPSKFSNHKIIGNLVRFKDVADTTGRELWITKNELNKLKNKKSSR